jgi:mRNA interferase RelE/StbE
VSSGAPWSIEIERSAERDIARLDRQVRNRVFAAIETLAIDPDHATGVRKLVGRPELRLRIGDWRAIFEIDRNRRTVIIQRVRPRGRAYDR